MKLHLSPDEALGTEADPLSQAACNLEAPKFPLLPANTIKRFKIVSCTHGPTKDDPNRTLMTIVCATVKDEQDADGKPLHSGFKVFNRIGTSPSEGDDVKRPRTIKNIAEDLGMWLKAVGMKDTSPRQWIANPTLLEGQILDARVGISKDKSGQFPDSNTLKPVLPA